ncbi:UPAR/Ly6 domain-containing protein crok-like [Onthophagus taurus]|uniref:UPAR/Ly6 domain-containing protein crok-like n=1 Tax=Onthophagus taurus TaxID=166361 RepID=UPI000C20B4EE|nr:uncharacterized protein LOC111419252 [Onthophagus taurus]XP_022920285.1 uncharacterized protein LOC111428816 [Onthophagus taurus]
MGGSVLVFVNVLILGSFIIECLANSDNSQTSEHKPIQCYDCNSEYDPRCGLDFDNYTIGVVNCNEKRKLDHMKTFVPILCRKVIQKVHGKIRVIRGCGYIKDEDHDDKECYTRSGTHDVKVTYCSCTTSLCNGAPRFGYPAEVSAICGTAFLATIIMTAWIN